MSVVEFSADSWQAVSPGLARGLGRRAEVLSDLAAGLTDLVGSDQITGRGADAMRAYIREVHLPLIQSLQLCVSTFQTAIGVYWNGYSQVDAGGDFRLVNDEFDAHLVQLESGMADLYGFGARLRQISADAAHIVSLGSAGGDTVDQTVTDLQAMHLIAKTQQEAWAAYEATDPGFNQVKELISEVGSILNNIGNLTVGQGRNYMPGSFRVTFDRLGELTSGMVEYCRQNEKTASQGWEHLIGGYVADVEAARREEALWDLLWDGVQIVAGAVITVVGVGLTPFTGGFSLGLTVLGGSLLVGGVNSAINHVSIAASGEELNLIGNMSNTIGQWYDMNIARPAVESGSWGLELLAGAGSGIGTVVGEAAQLNVHEVGQSVWTLATDQGARGQLWDQLMTTVGKVGAGDAFTIGEIIGSVIVPGAGAVKFAQPGSLLSKISKTDGPGNLDKPIKIGTPKSPNELLDRPRNDAGSEEPAATGIDPLRNPGWLNDLLSKPDLLPWRRRLAEGQQFNYQNHYRYPQNEVRLGNNKVLDSYKSGLEIVSRKNSQLASIRLPAGKQYIDEMLNKYAPGTSVRGGGNLAGDLILEIPVQAKAVPLELLEYAKSRIPPVMLRDTQGHIYE